MISRMFFFFFFQAEDGIRDAQESRGLGDVYKRQVQENDNQLGLAHFMEHMGFNGSKHFPKNELVDFLQKTGVDFGADLNAYTSFDETVYILSFPTEDPTLIDKGF